MSQGKETGIVLSKKISGEADNICCIFTRNSGKENFIFRGLKKSTKRPRTASEPGSILELVYYTGRPGSLNTVSEFNILTTYNSIRKNSGRIFSLYFILELVDLTTGFSDPNSRIFNLLSAGIETLAESAYPLHFTLFFAVKYLILQGVFPDTGRCSWCGNTSIENLIIENKDFRTSCVNCADTKTAVIQKKGTEFLNMCVNNKLDKIDCMNYPYEEITPVIMALIEYINSYYGIKLKTGSMLMHNCFF